MKVVLVGDNRASLNWGRGADIALFQLLAEHFEIAGTVSGSEFLLHSAGYGYVHTLTPARYVRVLLRTVHHHPKTSLGAWYVKLEKLFGAKDFIAADPEESVANLVRYRHRHPELSRLYNLVRDSDMLVVNGNGDMIFTTPPRREVLFLLAMVQLGISLGKPVAFVNSMISDCPMTGRNQHTFEATTRLLSKCKVVALRDPTSVAYAAREMPSVRCVYIPDTLFLWYPWFENLRPNLPANGDFVLPYPEKSQYFGKLDFSRPYVCIGGSGVAAKCGDRLVPHFVALVKRFQELRHAVYLTVNDGPDSFLEEVASLTGAGVVPLGTSILMAGVILANARLFISGRYHPAIFASLGGTPCVCLDSQAHKMLSLQEVLDYESPKQFPLQCSHDDIEDIVSLTSDYLRQGETLRKRIRTVACKRAEEAKGLVRHLQSHI